MKSAARFLPVGAEVLSDKRISFRVWASAAKKVAVVFDTGGNELPLERESEGYFAGETAAAKPGDRYRFRLNGEKALYADPVSRFQPEGPFGPSQIVDPSAFRWTDKDWSGVPLERQIVYEMHIGTFTEDGNWAAAIDRLPALAELGVTLLEVMPVADFPGRFGWGYDGVNLFAPTRLYGSPDDFRRFVDQAHALKLGVILDVVYNHIGPSGNFLKVFSKDYFTDRYANEWGEALNFDGDNSGPVREFFASNAAYWIKEYHLDGLRLDATQQIFDNSEEHILAVIGRKVREAAGGRATFIVAESETQDARLIQPLSAGGYGLDAVWNDDFHHTARVAMTGRAEAYYTDYGGSAQEFVSTAKHGYLFQGQYYQWQKKGRGTPTLGHTPERFVTFIENHDQVANSASGRRCHELTNPGMYRAMTAFLFLAPGTPALFQGQEFAASSPFVFFADHEPDLAILVRKGRKKFISQFSSCAGEQMQALIPDPGSSETFQRCKLNWAERGKHGEIVRLHQDLIKLRQTDAVFSARPQRFDGAVLGPRAFVLRYFGDAQDRLLVVNFEQDLNLRIAPEPLLAPPSECVWQVQWSSDEPHYGGCGASIADPNNMQKVPGFTLTVLASVERTAKSKER